MARYVILDLSSKLVIIDGRATVHRSLLESISPEMRYHLEEREDIGPVGRGAREKTVRSPMPVPFRLDLFEVNCEEEFDRAVELWASFLYGQSMFDYDVALHRVVDDEYDALLQVIKVAQMINHVDAEDAALDAIREFLNRGFELKDLPNILTKAPLDSRLAQMLLDFMVYRGQSKTFTATIEQGIDRYPESPKKSEKIERSFRVTNKLCKMFIRKAEDESAGLPLPDLMRRCRYHTHIFKGEVCYLTHEVGLVQEHAIDELEGSQGSEEGKGPALKKTKT